MLLSPQQKLKDGYRRCNLYAKCLDFLCQSPKWVMHALNIWFKPLDVVDGATCTVINLGSWNDDPNFLLYVWLHTATF